MITKWQELLGTAKDDTAVVDLPSWISRATLDALGGKCIMSAPMCHLSRVEQEAAFDYKFGAIESSGNELSRAYQNMLSVLLNHPHS
jgi:hypothetical protein